METIQWKSIMIRHLKAIWRMKIIQKRWKSQLPTQIIWNQIIFKLRLDRNSAQTSFAGYSQKVKISIRSIKKFTNNLIGSVKKVMLFDYNIYYTTTTTKWDPRVFYLRYTTGFLDQTW